MAVLVWVAGVATGALWAEAGAARDALATGFHRHGLLYTLLLRAPEVVRSGWLHYFSNNLSVLVLAYPRGCISFGALPLWVAFGSGKHVGWTIASMSGVARETTGAGPIAVAAGVLLPHGVVEVPALLLSLGLSLRAGMALLLPVRGLSRRQSLVSVTRQFAGLLPAIVPLLLAAAALEWWATPVAQDRLILRLARGTETRVGRPFETFASEWSPDGRRLAVVDMPRQAVGVMASEGTGRLVAVAKAPEGMAFAGPSWSPDGTMLVVAERPLLSRTGGSALILASTAGGQTRRIADGPAGDYLGAAWSPKGEKIAVLVGDRRTRRINVWLFDLALRRWRQLTRFPEGQSAAPIGLTWHPSGDLLACTKVSKHAREAVRAQDAARSSGSDYTICTVKTDGTLVRDICPLARYSPLSWSPDGKWLAYIDGGTGLSGKVRTLGVGAADTREDLGLADRVSSLSWYPDGRRLAYQRFMTTVVRDVGAALK